MKKDLIGLIDSRKEIEKKFHSFDGGMGTSFEQISDVPEFQNWLQEIKLELQGIYDRTHDIFVWETINLCGKRMDGVTEKKYFIELAGKLQAIRKNIDKYYPEEKVVSELPQSQGGVFCMKKKPLIFISHSSKNKDQVAKIADLLRSINLSPRRDIFCSALPGYGIPNGANIFDFLRERFLNYDLHIIFVHSPEYYESAVSLNEMGAAWVLRTNATSLLLPGFDFSGMKGVIGSDCIAIKLDGDRSEVKDRLNQLRRELESEFDISDNEDIIWEEARDKFIREIKYKWEMVKCFQVNWNVNADDFAAMLTKSLSKAAALLNAANYYPVGMITEFAEKAQEDVRAMFIALFDETKEVYERIDAFKRKSQFLLERYGNGAAQHYQHENAIFAYLWLRYPDKYYLYKLNEIKAISNKLESSYTFKKGAYADNIHNFLAFYNEICDELKQDDELKNLLTSQITETCYPDLELRTLTMDIGFFISRYDLSKVNLYANLKPNFWKISHGNDCISEAEAEAFEKRQVIVVHRDTAAKGKSKVSQGEDFMATMKKGDFFYLCRGNSIRLLGCIDSDEVNENPEKQDGWCERSYTVIAKSRDTSAYTGDKKWWTPNDNSTCIIVPISETQLFEDYILKPYFDITKEELLKNDTSGLHYWFLNANPKIWSMSSMPIGEVQDYTLYNDNGNKRRIFQNFLDAKAGDMVIGYESTPVKQIVAILRVSAEQDGQKIYFEKVEGLSSPIDFSTLKECPELEKMEYFSMTQGSLFKLTRGEYDFIIDMIREENLTPSDNGNAKYTKADFLRDVYMTEAKYDRLKAVLEKKKNIILQGAPGVGKTFAAKRLAYSVMGEVDDDRIEFVQFHQNYSYEDFMMGYKPVGECFELKYGIFYRFCQKAANHPDKDYFFIIDEINRGSMSKIFGELLMLIEADYRDKKATLAYNGLSFSVPKRVHIIGMMNTADRSLAMIDYALRRRFSFFDMEPGFDSEGFINYQNSFANDTFNTLIERIKELNREIAADKSLGKGFCIGHSYFCNADDCVEEWMKDVVDFDILPMLSEYWFDDSSKLQRWENILHGVFQ